MIINNTDNQAPIREAGGIQAILRAMQRHVTSEDVQQCACKALTNLAANIGNRFTIADAGGLSRIVLAMKHHSRNENVQGYACKAITNLSRNNITIKRDITHLGGIDCIVSAMRQHSCSEYVQEYACKALSNLVRNNEDSVAVIERTGVIECIIAAMHSYLPNDNLQLYACRTFSYLATHHEFMKRRMLEGNAISCLTAIMRKHEENKKLVDLAYILWNTFGELRCEYWSWSCHFLFDQLFRRQVFYLLLVHQCGHNSLFNLLPLEILYHVFHFLCIAHYRSGTAECSKAKSVMGLKHSFRKIFRWRPASKLL